jgi:hypothetical protein
MLFPSAFALANGMPDFSPGPEYRYAMGMGAALMAGWTVLLLWADRKPAERRGILLITVLPVITGMALNEILAVQSGFLALEFTFPRWILQGVLSLFFGLSYWKSTREA